MRITEHDTLDGLFNDMVRIAKQAPDDMRGKVREAGKVGNTVAKDFARTSSRAHARKYPGTFTVGALSQFRGAAISVYSVEYGPEHRGQGELAPILENGSRNNKAHLNLARSADLIGPSFAQEVGRLADGWFWGAEA